MTKFQDLRDRVTFQEDVNAIQPATRSPGGVVEPDWVNRGTRWGEIKPLSANRQIIAQANKSVATHTITIWKESGISTTWRIVCGSRVFEILGETVRELCWMEYLVREIQS